MTKTQPINGNEAMIIESNYGELTDLNFLGIWDVTVEPALPHKATFAVKLSNVPNDVANFLAEVVEELYLQNRGEHIGGKHTTTRVASIGDDHYEVWVD